MNKDAPELFEAKFRHLLADIDARQDDPAFAKKRQKLHDLYEQSVDFKN